MPTDPNTPPGGPAPADGPAGPLPEPPPLSVGRPAADLPEPPPLTPPAAQEPPPRGAQPERTTRPDTLPEPPPVMPQPAPPAARLTPEAPPAAGASALISSLLSDETTPAPAPPAPPPAAVPPPVRTPPRPLPEVPQPRAQPRAGGAAPRRAAPRRRDLRPILVVALALVALAAIAGYFLRDSPPSETRDLGADVQAERPPGMLDEGDGFRPSVVGDDLDDAPTRLPDTPADDGAPTASDEAPGLEQPPQRAPLSASETAPGDAPASTALPGQEAFAEAYLTQATGGTVAPAMHLYAPTVRYYDRGRVSVDVVQADKEAYVARFPERRYVLSGPVRVVSEPSARVTTLRFDYTFDVGGGRAGRRSGRGWTELDVVPLGDTFLIQGERGDVY